MTDETRGPATPGDPTPGAGTSPEASDSHEELRIEVSLVPVRVVTRGGAKFLAEVFVHRASDLHPGAETLLDRLNNPRDRFLPCRVGGRDELIHLAQVAMIEQDGANPEVTALDRLAALHVATEIELVTGQTLRGDAVYLAPSQRSRISDLLNHPTDTFLLMVTGEICRFIHRGAIVRVRL